jgi:hypothetical protein
MSNVLILTKADADAVRGDSMQGPSAGLQPVPLNDGSFYLGTGVLNDPAHEYHHARLSACPVVAWEAIQDRLTTSDHD